MKRSIILIISLLLVVASTSQAQQSEGPILTVTLDTTDLTSTKQQLFNILIANDLVLYPELRRDLDKFINEAVKIRSVCTGDCPSDPKPVLTDQPCLECYSIEMSGLVNASPSDSIHAGYLQLEQQIDPMSHQYFNGVMAVYGTTFNFARGMISNKLLLFSLVGPGGRSNIQAIIIADKHILRQRN
ncbi:MAG: hypothetical protein AAGG75_19415 [Bacteroidota bacterium]